MQNIKDFIKDKIYTLKNHDGFMKYFRNSFWLFFEKILRMFIGLFVGIWIARYLGPQQLGNLNYAQSFVGLFSAIATLGLDGIIVRELVKQENRNIELIGTAFWLKVFGSLIVLLAISVAVQFTKDDSFTNLLIFIIASSTIFQSFNVIDFYFQSKVLSKYAVYANIVTILASNSLKLILIYSKASLLAFTIAILLDSVFLAISYIYFFKKNAPKLKIREFKFCKKTASFLLRNCWPMAITIFVVMSYLNLNQIILKNYLGEEKLAYYSVAYRLAMLADFIPMVIVGSVFPKIVQFGNDLNNKKIQALMNLLILLSIILALSIFAFADLIIKYSYGAVYKDASGVLRILAFLSIFSFLGYLSGRLYVILHLEKLYLFRAILGLIILYISSTLLVENYGIHGAAYSLLISEFFVTIIADLFFYQKTKLILKLKIQGLISFWNIKLIYKYLLNKEN